MLSAALREGDRVEAGAHEGACLGELLFHRGLEAVQGQHGREGRRGEGGLVEGEHGPGEDGAFDEDEGELGCAVLIAGHAGELSGGFKPTSDVDVLVDFAPGQTPGLALIDMQDELSALLHNRRVDLVTEKFLNRRIRQSVLSSAVVVYEE